jgi:hypothetical protein
MRIGEYVIDDRLGEGGMGVVYAATHPTIGKRVAIKVMKPRLGDDPEAIERFTHEARAVCAIHHPSIVDVFGFGTLPDGRPYFVMELLAGESLRMRMERGTVDAIEAIDILYQIARALEVAHDHGVVHRDLKPENVFLQRVARERPMVKLLDFGIAKLAMAEGVIRTQTGQTLGTPLYMSPEQCRGRGIDQRTDIYSLGCIGYELLCGGLPFEATSVAELFAAHLTRDPPRPRSLWRDIPTELDEPLYAMLAKDPARRPTLTQIRECLRTLPAIKLIAVDRGIAAAPGQWLTPIPQPARDSPLRDPTPAPTTPRTNPWLAVLVVGASATALVLAFFAFLLSRSNKPEVAQVVSAAHDAAASHVVDIPNDAAVRMIDRDADVDATPQHVQSAPADDIALLALGSKPPCEILVDGRALHLQTPQRALKLRPGHHRVTLVNQEYSIQETFTVDLKTAQPAKVIKDYSAKLHQLASPW